MLTDAVKVSGGGLAMRMSAFQAASLLHICLRSRHLD